MSQNKDIIRRFSAWYFSKRVLPYWAILLADSFIVFLCCVFTFWITYKTQSLLVHWHAVFYTALMYSAISWIGARVFRTYSGVLRYSSFVDLMKLTYANGLSLVIVLLVSLVLRKLDVSMLVALEPLLTWLFSCCPRC